MLNGKKALVLGGSRGIGAAVVERLASEGAETHFTFSSNQAAAERVASATGARAVRLDSAVREGVDRLIAELEPLDVLVIAAGVLVMGDPLDTDPDAVDSMIDVNLRSPYHAATAGARAMPGGGRIVVIGSTNGDRMPMPGGAAYAMTKSAMQGMVRGLARDFAPLGITINNVQPGPVDTDMNPADGPMAEAMHSFMAIKRHIRPAEIASMVAYLASAEAAMITGAQMTVDGGYAA